MPGDIENATETVVELANTVGATAIGVQNSQQTVRSLRRISQTAARRPEMVAIVGLGLLGLSGILALAKSRGRTSE